ncbi:hypothetical protein K435DRAFT_961866 [Dendrothele bispora CBS 962.96]|uniref:F-box domain-containing protein n=1 Tax=Dendrothele bispora (strain CBS 962.96) TaxID=1314807 RepID=A0A4S8MNM3_DENBC|nr:hypothetical protein K435DRAFT_961866 [Dendrothele bispora CBS 962.96]
MEASTSQDPIRPEQEYDTEAEPSVSPIDQLPNEILARIFEYCCPVDIGHRDPAFMRVRSRWRSVAISSPHVWTSVKLNLVPTRQYSFSGRVPSHRIGENLPKPRLLALHLGYSKDLPLVMVHISLADDRRQQVINCLQMIIQHASRWTSLQLSFHGRWNDLGVDGLETVEYLNMIQTLPLLQDFICLTKENPSQHRFSFPGILEKVARGKLQKLVLARFNSSGVARGFSLPSVTQLVLHLDMQSDDIFSVVRYCPRLVHLKYIIDGLENRSGLGARANSGSILRNLESYPQRSQTVKTLQIKLGEWVRGHTGQLFPRLIKSLNLPALTSMTISTSKQFRFTEMWPAQEFNDFFARSGCDLEALKLNSVSLADYQVMYLLLKTPRLLDLSIREIPRSPQNPNDEEGLDFPVTRFLLRELRILHDVETHRPLVPKLKRLRLSVNASVKESSGEVAFDEGTFMQMVSSRSLPPVPQQDTVGLSEEDMSIVPPSLDDSNRCLKDVKLRVYERTKKRN